MNGDLTSDLTRPLTAEIVFPPFSTMRKALLTSKRYKINSKCNKKHEQKTVAALSIGDITSDIKRPLAAEIDKRPLLSPDLSKTAYNL
jgi:hypothetical protein